MGAKKSQKTAARSASRSIIGKIKTRLGINNSQISQKNISSKSTTTNKNNQQKKTSLKKSSTEKILSTNAVSSSSASSTTTTTTTTLTSTSLPVSITSSSSSSPSLTKKQKSNQIDGDNSSSTVQRKISLNVAQQKSTNSTIIKNCSTNNSQSSTTSSNNKSTTVKEQQKSGSEDKTKAINKMLKNLDIKISGFKNIISDEKKVVECCNASISEVVKTKYRAAAVKTNASNILNNIGSGSVISKSLKKEDCNQTKKDKEIFDTSSLSASSFVGCESENSTIVKMSQIEMLKSNCSDTAEMDKMTKNNEMTKMKKCSTKKDDENQSNAKKCSKDIGESGQQISINKDNRNATSSAIKKNKNKSQTKSFSKVTSTDNEKLNDSKETKGKSTSGKTEKDSNISKISDENINVTLASSSEQQVVVDKKTKTMKNKAKDSSMKKTPENRKKLKTNSGKNNFDREEENGQVLNLQELHETKETEVLSKNSNDDDKLEMKSDNSLNVKKKQKSTTTAAVTKKNQKSGGNSSVQKKCKKVNKSPPDKLSEQVKNTKKDSKNEQNSKSTAKKVKKVTTKKGQNQNSNELIEDKFASEKDKINAKSKCNKSKGGGKANKNTDMKTANVLNDNKTQETVIENTEKESILTVPKANDGIIEGNNENEKQNIEENITDTSKIQSKEISEIQEIDTGKLTETNNKTGEITEKSLETGKNVKSNKSSVDKNTKALSVRERLQKKYVNTSTFKVYKNLKQSTEKTVKKLEENSEIDLMKAADMMMKSDKETKNESNVVKPEKDVYDFKTESEDEDNIKMNLLMNETVKALLEKDFSDEDDKPLHLTKLELEDEDNKPLSQCKEEQKKENKQITSSTNQGNQKRTNSPVKAEKKSSEQNENKNVTSSAGGKIKDEKKQVKFSPKKTALNNAKRAKEKSDYHSSTSSESSTDSEDNNLYLRKKASFGPKRMASLNALAKVQCLYENESRTAHELGLSKTMAIPKIKTLHSSSGSEEEKDSMKKDIQTKDQIKKEPTEYEPKRELRNAPGLRGVGKHWDFDDVSDFESGHESDIPYRKDYDVKSKKKKSKVPKQKATKSKEKAETKVKKTYKPQKKKVKTSAAKKSEIESTSEEDKNEESEAEEKSPGGNKRKRDKTDDFIGELKGILARKRIASLNASALVAATYDIERHLDRNLGSDCSSFESFPEDEKPQITNKENKNSKEVTTKSENGTEENGKESGKENSSRPTSSSVVIVQDTDVTITGVYVNSSAGSGQESYCKMQYRVQSSVTEERVLCPTTIDPPKSYTPLGALSSMRPPGSNLTEGGQQSSHHQSTQPQSMVSQQPSTNIYQSPSVNEEQSQQNIHMYPSHHYHQSSTGLPTISAPHHQHHQELPQYPTAAHHHYPPPPPPTSQQLKYQHLQHHHPFDVTPPSSHQSVSQLSQGRCESPLSLRYQSAAAAAYQSPIPPPPTISMSASSSSAFCAPIQQSHHDITGYYQPAGPLISPHILPPVPPPGNAALVSSKQVPSPLSSDPEQQLQPPSQSVASAAESSDSEVLITGGDLSTFRYSSQQPQTAQSQQQQQLSVLSSQHQQHQQSSAAAYTRSMHQMHYPPAYPPSYYTPYPGDAMCYSPPYQPYFPAKVYQSAPTAAYRRYPSYYQPGPPPPADLYEPPPPSSAAPPPPTGSQLVPAGPTAPQHMEHYPGPPGFYSGYSPGGGQCYSRGIQPPYMDYPAPCPCPMQSCPKNVLTGPLIGSNNSGNNNNNNTVSMNNNSTTNSVNMNTNMITNSNNSSSISSKNANNNNNSTQISQSQVNSNLNNLSQTLKSNKGPVSVINQHSITNSSKTSHNHNLGQIESANIPSTNGTILGSNKAHLHHHHMHQCKMEIIEPSAKTDLSISSERKDERKNSQYEEEVVIPPVPPANYTINDKLIEPDITVSPARGSTGLPIVPDQTDKAATAPVIPAIPVNSASHQIGSATIPRESVVVADTTPATAVAAANNGNITPMIGRKARIGKTMAREMMYGAAIGTTAPTLHHHHQHQQHNVPPQQIFSHHHMHHHVPPASHHINPTTDSTMKVFQDQNPTIQNPTALKPNLDKVKKEEIKTEEEDVVVILDDEKQDVKQIKVEPDVVEVIDDRTESERMGLPERIDDDLFDTGFKESRSVKRMKIHEFNKSQCKKSPPNGYKSLIKQTERKPYLCISRKPEKKEHYRKVASKSGVKKRKLMLTEQQKNRLMIRKRKLLLMEKERQEQKDDENSTKSPVNVQSPVKEVENKEEIYSYIVISSPVPSPDIIARTEIDLEMIQQETKIPDSQNKNKSLAAIIESNVVAKGYSSEPDIRSTTTGRKTKKTKSTEARSKSESKKSAKEAKQQRQQQQQQQQQQTEQICSLSTSKKNQNVESSRATESKSREIIPQVMSTDSDSSVTREKCSAARKAFVKQQQQQQQNTEKLTKSSKTAHKTKASVTTTKAMAMVIDDCNEEPIQGTVIGDNRTINNNILEANNNNKLPESIVIDTPESVTVTAERLPISSSTLLTSFTSEDLMPHVQPLVIHPTIKRQRSRTTRRFSSSRKRKRNTHVNDEVNDMMPLPRKLNVVPRWNNGWSWQGEPFQGKVFLNSDDPLVVRTCYPSMVHVEGDVIRPRDCVLLRAGNKKNELPYVAKVAHLWENPEDGEMMMSLLWYYRPEHTEQGRQPNDCPDEVFASRHRDHNSVACIEDKCYVLTFAEYCRYRRSLRAAEEGIDEPVSIVPPLYNYHSPREVPINTNPELVMFCQRVYEFRLKRLLKTPTS